MAKDYLVILPCSKRKKDLDCVPAVELYNGPFYQILRKYPADNIDILIISAKYGLISSHELISNYDIKMTKKIASELTESISNKLHDKLRDHQYKEIFINLGQLYMLALGDISYLVSKNNCIVASGQIGERMHQLKEWLNTINEM